MCIFPWLKLWVRLCLKFQFCYWPGRFTFLLQCTVTFDSCGTELHHKPDMRAQAKLLKHEVPAMLWPRYLKPQITCITKPLHINRYWMHVYRLQLDVYTCHCFRHCKVAAERKLRKDARLQSVTSWSIHIFSETWQYIKVMDKYQLSQHGSCWSPV